MKKKLTKKELKEKRHRRWVVNITIATFFMTLLISYISDVLLSNTPIFAAFIILLVIISLGILSDIVGIAVTAVSIEPFNAMASKRIKGAKTSVALVKDASRVSNFCNDVVGDICSIVSGVISITIVIQLGNHYPLMNVALMTLILSSVVACFTVGGKALGKDVAMKNGTSIIHGLSVIIASVKIAIRGKE
ncbi:hypothetical protein [Acetobacterium bakii]|uniref:Mg2+ and Co2+ transporter CorB n=1 Tax=Acetobacterium bakii TaxID=52689 RepID=A0A0L6U4Y7_9FIRM|nr:hypothetical protein [Acetobacterium bakii]KNZ43599.1 hypothetical protein AKG39_00095 [Acetobacterium bakii]